MTLAYRYLVSSRMEDPRLYRRIATALTERIADGRLTPGERLNIGLLTDEFDTTRTTVGKALKLLEADERVVRFAGLGWYVTDATP
jgi:DNA-binding GntR family transcriptional regulator